MTGLVHHVAADPAVLADVLARSWLTPGGDPLALDVVCSPGPGTSRWLAQELSRRLGGLGRSASQDCPHTIPSSVPPPAPGDDGVAAGIQFCTLDRLVDHVVSRARPGAADWSGEPLAQAVLAALSAVADEPWAGAVARHVGRSADRPRRPAQLARRLALLIERYLRWAPELVTAWLADPAADRVELPHPPADPVTWQAGLLRRLARDLGPPPCVGSADLLDDWRSVDPLPRTGRIAVFCPDSVSPFAAGCLAALAVHHEVAVFTRQPAAHPLGQALTQLARAAETALASLATERALAASPPLPPTVLGAVQAVFAGVTGPPLPLPADDTVQFHVSHGPDRQADVLRDLLIGFLADDPTLEPRDILVVCPRLDDYQAWLDAAFAPPSEDVDWAHPAHRLRVSGPTATRADPLLDLLFQLVDLTDSRAGAGQLLALSANPAVSASFGWGPADIERLRDLIRASGLRWGISASRRRPFGLGDFPENTWQAGLARLAAGAAAPEDELRPAGTALPLESVEADQIPLVGSLLELTGRLRRIVDLWAEPAPGPVWAERGREALALVAGLGRGQAWARTEAMGVLAELAETGPTAPPLDAADLAVWLDAAKSRRRGRSRLLTGDLTVCGPFDLRLVPHRVICWVGLDADTFPRHFDQDGDDVLAESDGWGPGPNVTWLDRQAFADSLRAARDRFIVVYRGHDPVDNAEFPPPGPVRDLMELTRQVVGPTPPQRLVHHHPLPRLDPSGPRQDRAAAVGALACPRDRVRADYSAMGLPSIRARPRDRATPPATPPGDPVVVTLDDLAALTRPAAHYLRWRAGLAPSLLADEAPDSWTVPDEVPLALDGLARWQITDRLLRLSQAGHDPAAVLAAERLRGDLPPKALGGPVLDQCWRAATSVLRAAAQDETAPEVWHDIDLDWPDLPRLTGQVATRGQVVLTLQAGRPRPGGQLTAWLAAVALRVAEPETPWRAVIVAPRQRVELPAPDPAEADRYLASLLRLHAVAGREPLPLPCSTGLWAAPCLTRGQRPDPVGLALSWRQEWAQDTAWRTVWPDPDALVTAPPQPADGPALRLGPGADPGPPTRFEVLAHRVYGPLFRAGAVLPRLVTTP